MTSRNQYDTAVKKILLLTCLSLVLISLAAAQKSEIKFLKTSLNKVIKQAQKENKYIFIDAYTTWCGPCKMMDREVFTDKEVGAHYNANFVNAKFDMEKGDGVVVSDKYDVRSYPTFLYLDSDGNLLHKVSSYRPKRIFMAIGDEALEFESPAEMRKRLDAQGGDDPELMVAYIDALIRIGNREKADKLITKFLKSGADWENEDVRRLMINVPGEIDSDRFAYIIENNEGFREILGESAFIKAIQQEFFRYATKGGTFPSPTKMDALYVEYGGSLKDQLSKYYRVANTLITGNGYLDAVWSYYSEYPCDDCLELNNIAWDFYEQIDDEEKLLKAVEWAQRSVDIEKNYYNLDTLAWLLHKTGQTSKAKEIAKEAIAIAKANGEDYSSTSSLLK